MAILLGLTGLCFIRPTYRRLALRQRLSLCAEDRLLSPVHSEAGTSTPGTSHRCSEYPFPDVPDVPDKDGTTVGARADGDDDGCQNSSSRATPRRDNPGIVL